MRLAGTLILWILSLVVLLVSVVIGVVAHKAPYVPALYAAVAAGILVALFLNPLFVALTRLERRPRARWALVGAAFLAGIVGSGFSIDEILFAPARAFNQAVALAAQHPGDKATAERAASLYQRACAAKVYEACHNLAVLHDIDGPLARDPALTGPLYEKACAHDVPGACVNRGRQYLAGDGVKADTVRARDFYTKGCDAKIVMGCNGLLTIDMADYLDRKPGAKARVLADSKRACEIGNEEACGHSEFLNELTEDDASAADNAAAGDDAMASDAPAVDDPPAKSAPPATTHNPAPVATPPSKATHRRPPHRSHAHPPQLSGWSIT